MEKKDLVIKFLNNECDAAAAASAMQLIADDPDILDELAPKSEWDEPHPTPIPQSIDKAIWRRVAAATQKAKLVALWKPLAVAASVLAIVISVFLLKPSTQQQYPVVVIHEAAVKETFDTVVNNGDNIYQVSLADGSRIGLYARSSVVYATGFKNKRTIFLEGKAIFHVAKDASSPFIVYSGAITTTALGTVFMVNARAAATAINVQLYEGKVVVKSVSAQLPVADTYLKPGEQCLVDLALAQVKVSNIPQSLPVHNNREVLAQVEKNKVEEGALAFEKSPLNETFARLQHIFKQPIIFEDRDQLQNLFTGRFDQKDSLLQILQVIAAMNNLQVAQEGNGFRLTQKATAMDPKPEVLAVPPPAVKPPVITDSNTLVAPAGVDEVRIVELPTGRDYRKIPLSKLFDQIAKTNHITIQYQQEEIRELYFTGTISHDQSSIDMLQVICRMNGLKLVKKKGGIYTVNTAKQ